MKFSTALFFGMLVVAVVAQADPRMWGEAGIAVRQGSDIHFDRQIAQDPDGNTLVVWSEVRTFSRDIFAQLISPMGEPMWDEPLAVTEEVHRQVDPMAVHSADGWIVVWEDMRNTEPMCEE